MSLPRPLNYAVVKPGGFPSFIRNTTFTPQTIYNNIQLNDTIRIEMRAKGFLDPYTTMVNIDVQVDDTQISACEIKKLDQSAQSLISELNILCKGTTIEHIQEYDQLASVLHDMNFSPQYRRSRDYEGHADYSNQSQNVVEFSQRRPETVQNSTIQFAQQHQTVCHPLIAPITSNHYAVGRLGRMYATYSLGNDTHTTIAECWGTTPFSGFFDWTFKGAALAASSTSIVNLYTKRSPFGLYQSTQNTQESPGSYESALWRYEFSHQLVLEAYEKADDYDSVNRSISYDEQDPNKLGSYTGYIAPKVQSFSDCADGEPYFAGNNIKILQMIAGQPKRVAGRKYLSFSFPLLSAIFGTLIPPDTYRYIPLSAFEELIFEFKLNPFAFYTSGYESFVTNADNKLDPVGIALSDYSSQQTVQFKRQWSVVKIELNCDLLSFQQTIESQIDAQFASSQDGIVIQTCGWCTGPSYTFANNAQIQGTYAINMGFNSLKAMFFLFNPLDYQKYTFCRKLYRINGNITKFQLQVGQDLVPIEGIKGHAGYVHPTAESKYQCNKNYLINLFKAFNKLHDMRGNCIITPYNFAVNDRPYDPTFKGASVGHVKTHVIKALGDAPVTASNVSTITNPLVGVDDVGNVGVFPINTHTSAGQALFHENRVFGRSLFGIDTETMSTDFSVLSGLNTTEARPFNLILESDTTAGGFTRDMRMVIFFYYDMIVQLKRGSLPIISGRQ